MTKTNRRFNSLNLAVLVVFLLCGLGFSLARTGHAGINKVIQGTAPVVISVYIVGLKTVDVNLFKVGDKTAITIRNQPVQPPMTIVDVKHWPKQISFLSTDGKKAVAFADPSQAIAHDFLITVKDEAEVTQDGYVIRGNKIKIGNQIDLEGFNYRVQGVVADLHQLNK